jgi:3'-5' exoribonuclease-like protein
MTLLANPAFGYGLLSRIFGDFCGLTNPPEPPVAVEPEPDVHVMLDVETWGTNPGCAIRSIGAVAFNMEGKLRKSFYVNVTDTFGFTEDDTVEFWKVLEEKHPEILRWFSIPAPYSLSGALLKLFDFFKGVNGKYLWCHGASFDEPIIRSATYDFPFKAPWDHRNVRDTRTLYELAGFKSDKEILPRDETKYRKHHALDDALYQTECVRIAYKKIKDRHV